ncbi:endonuclease/exonuclease/phosphatase family protein [bacterium]|nr:endonuclease/exonuclease/phosphatase family protein [bacterium]
MKKALKWVGIGVSIPILLFGLFVLSMVIADFKPPEVTDLSVFPGKRAKELTLGDTFALTTFNIGYCGLDKGRDFFMDGGLMSRSESHEKTLENCVSILDFIKAISPDILLIQEIDVKASRSWKLNQLERFRNALPEYNNVFALNYKVSWVPVPMKNPMGSVHSGLCTFSKYPFEHSRRLQLPGKEDFPRQLFVLDRCLLETVIPMAEGKKLILINLHLSAYDKGGKVRKHQIKYVKDYIAEKYDENTYLILGGDWNHLLSKKQLEEKRPDEVWPAWLVLLPDDFTPETFHWAVDESIWTCRDNDAPYVEGENFVTVIDGFLLSPNIEVISVKGHDLGFTNSDHNPVSAVLRFK